MRLFCTSRDVRLFNSAQTFNKYGEFYSSTRYIFHHELDMSLWKPGTGMKWFK